MKLYYIANIRIPTERAHSLQIMKMCEAFAGCGADVELIIPNRADNIGVSEIFQYYGVKNTFKIKRIPSTDFLGKTLRFGKLLYWIDLLTFLVNLHLRLVVDENSVIYSRDQILLTPFSGKKCRMWLEIHDIPARKLFFWRILERVHGIVAITRHLKNELVQNGLNKEKIMVAPDAVDLKDFNILISKEEARAKLELPQDKKIVMYIGLFEEWKGYGDLLEASRTLPEEIKVVMIGGEDRQVNLLTKKYPNVQFLGFRPYYELSQNQKAADILAIPNSAKFPISKYFTSPLKLFAHMASSVPIIASDLPSLREILDESMANFFVPDNPQDLSRAIISTLDSYDEALIKAKNSYRAVQKYSWQKRAENIAARFYA